MLTTLKSNFTGMKKIDRSDNTLKTYVTPESVAVRDGEAAAPYYESYDF